MLTSVFRSLELPESSGYKLSLCSKKETSYPKGPWKKGKHFRSKVSSLTASKAPKPEESLRETNLQPVQTLRSAEPTGRSCWEGAKMVGGLWKDTSCLGLHCLARESTLQSTVAPSSILTNCEESRLNHSVESDQTKESISKKSNFIFKRIFRELYCYSPFSTNCTREE